MHPHIRPQIGQNSGSGAGATMSGVRYGEKGGVLAAWLISRGLSALLLADSKIPATVLRPVACTVFGQYFYRRHVKASKQHRS
jgi:hypothetical protein